MTIYRVRDRRAPIGDALDAAESDSVLVETDDHLSHAILPLDDDLIDYLLERNPRLIAECEAIGIDMAHGRYHTREEVGRILDEKAQGS